MRFQCLTWNPGKGNFSFRCSLERHLFASTQIDSSTYPYLLVSASEVSTVRGEPLGDHWESPPDRDISLSGCFPVFSLCNSIFLLIKNTI